MTPEQLKWTDEQWAAHLGCVATEVPKFKKYLTENFYLALWQEKSTGLKYAEVRMTHNTPSGAFRSIPIVVSDARDISLKDLIDETNNIFVPSLELKPHVATAHKVPTKLLQMLHIYDKQK